MPGSKTRTSSDDSMNVAAPDQPCVVVPFADGLGDVLLGVGDGVLELDP